jgi:2-succinyl-5-enolpyruvyl-6-hydroxy-3-cyclohexene-1-carboxylate synthase
VNRNTLQATTFVDELARSGLKHAVLAPGSRHTPLVLAFAEHPDITVHSHLDERSAAFYALGLALGTDAPVVLCCTSGTAGANYYPAIIEAHQSRVPLIVLTADRPPELRHSGTNQTIDQIKMFGDFVLWFVDVALPEANPSAVAIRNLRTTANRAYATANGLRKGVVHINMPFRKPLEPMPVEGDMVEVPEEAQNFTGGLASAQIHFGQRMPNEAMVQIAKLIRDHPNGIVIAGIRAKQSSFYAPYQFERFAEVFGYPFIADPVSGMRHNGQKVIGSYDTFISNALLDEPDIIIRFGDVPVSKSLNQFISAANPKHYIHFSESGDWSDDLHSITQLAMPVFDTLFMESIDRQDSSLVTHYASLEEITWQTIEHQLDTSTYFDGGVAYDIVDLIPPESTLFAGNSLPVRHLDQFGKPQSKRIHVHANRGASGIDGNISTALGLGKARPDSPLVALIGDVTFYHDMNGLLAVHRCGVPVTIVLLNNDGGGIFHRLPIKEYDPAFTDLFVTPHGLDYEHAARLYGLEFVRIDGHADDARARFREAFSTHVGAESSTIIEVQTDAKRDLARRDEIVAAVHTALNNHEVTKDSKK